jgi:hypothetical protein
MKDPFELTLRDYFAVESLRCFLKHPLPDGKVWNMKAISHDSYVLAEHMMRVRAKTDLIDESVFQDEK